MFGDGKQIKLLREILHELRELRNELFPSKLSIKFSNGDVNMSNVVTLTLTPPQTTNGTVSEIFQGKSYNPVPSDLTWSLQDSTVASLVQNADGSATFTPLAVGVTQVGCVDKTTGLSGTGTLTVVAGPDGLTISFSSPV